MDNRRRYIFSGNAAAFGGQIVKPNEFLIEAHGASSLPVSGGRSISRVGPPADNKFFHVDSAETFAEGFFEDPAGVRAAIENQQSLAGYVAVTHVRVDVRKFTLGEKFRLTVDAIHAELLSRSPRASGQPSVRVGKVAIEGVAINGHKLKITLDTGPCNRMDTHAKVLAGADDPKFVDDHGHSFFMRALREVGKTPPPSDRLVQADGTIYSTIVKSIEWDGAPYPGAQIDGNKVIIEPDFGVIHFGELAISEYSRRLTPVRAALGSEGGGSASGGDVESGGQWAP